MDYRLAHTLDRFGAHHDTFEDCLRAYVKVSEILFVLVVAVLLLAPGPRRALNRRAGVAAAASVAVALALAHVIAIAVDRPRPFVAHAISIHPFLTHAADPSFPSEHATGAFAIATAVALRLPWRGVVLLVLAAVVALGRVFLGLHYPSDVLAGALLGAAVAFLFHLPPMRLRINRVADAGGRALDAATGRLVSRRRHPSWPTGSA